MTIATIGLTFLSSLTLVSILLLVCLLILFLYNFIKKENYFSNFLKKNNLLFAFIVALIATLGSLFFSEIVGFEPCKLCWFQRIFMYPLVLILGVALIRTYKKIKEIVIPMSIIGGLFAAYHYIMQIKASSSVFCTTNVPCTSNITFYYGFISIPLMALTAFCLIIAFLMIKKK